VDSLEANPDEGRTIAAREVMVNNAFFEVPILTSRSDIFSPISPSSVLTLACLGVSLEQMRLTLLLLAIFYAWLPSGLCACRLQAALLPSSRDAANNLPDDSDDEDGPHECHCSGAKPICDVPAPACVKADDAVILLPVLAADVSSSKTAVQVFSSIPPFYHVLPAPLFLILRALLI
jgi:hypothetical protein